MKILIIGGTGLISTAIAQQLIDRGDHVVLYNRGRTPVRVAGDHEVITGDRKEFAAFEGQMSGSQWDGVIDMVCFKPDEAESAIRAFSGRASRYIFTSTVCVYNGVMTKVPATDDEPLNPLTDYGKNKSRCEELLMEAHKSGKLSVSIIRPSHTYGEGGGVIHSVGNCTTYIDRIRKGKPVAVHGDGTSLWASCHVEDAARAFVGAIDNPAASGEAYHVTSDEWITWDQYSEIVAKAVGGTANIVHIPSDVLADWLPDRGTFTKMEFQYNRIFDNSKAKRDLGFRYSIPFEEGVRRTVAWMEANGKIGNSDVEDEFYDALIERWRRAIQ